MPIDASIYNQLNNKPYNPLETVSSVANTANALSQNALIQANTANAQAENPLIQAQAQRQQLGLTQDQADLAMKQYQNMASYVLPLANDPKLSQKKIISAVTDAVANKAITPDQGNNFINNLPSDTPEKLQPMMHGLAMRLLDGQQKLQEMYGKQVQQNIGGQIQSGTQAPASQGGGFYPSTAQATTLTPESEAQRVETINKSGAKSTVPQSSLVTPTGMAKTPDKQSNSTDNNIAGEVTKEVPQSVKDLTDANVERYTALSTAAADSPTREDVIDNIIRITKDGIKTGKGQGTWNNLLGYAQNTPILGKAFTAAGAVTPLEKAAELQKFLYRNGLTQWQKAGGTGTDMQLEAQSNANPNLDQPPGAILALAKYGKAAEMALQDKANAADAYALKNNNDFRNYHQFESGYRQIQEPKIQQMKVMDPDEKATFVNSLSAEEARSLAAKMKAQNALRNSGNQ